MAGKRQLEEMKLKHQLWKKKARSGCVLQTMLISRAFISGELKFLSLVICCQKKISFSYNYVQNDKTIFIYFSQLLLHLNYFMWCSPVKDANWAPF